MSDSEKSPAFANDSDSSEDLYATQGDITSSVNTSPQALPYKSQSCPEPSNFLDLSFESSDSDEDPPFNLGILRRMLEEEEEVVSVSASSQEEITEDGISMSSEFPSVEENQEDIISESSDEDSHVNLRTLRRQISKESAASKEKTLNIVDPAELNQSPWTFVCQLKSAKYLKFAVEALRNPELSSQEEGRIDVDDNGFHIRVQNSTYNVAGHLLLNPARFRCTRPLSGKKTSLLEFSQKLAHVQDEATVYLAIHKQAEALDIQGDKKTRRIFVYMSSNAAEIREFPDTSLFFTTTVPSDDFRHMIGNLLQQQAPRQVIVDIKNNTATLRVGSDNSWTGDYPMLRADGSRGMAAGKSCSTTFEWSNAGIAVALQMASELDAEFVVLYDTERPENIILRFIFRDVGYLEFMKDSGVIGSSSQS